jgi:hypothetical protein
MKSELIAETAQGYRTAPRRSPDQLDYVIVAHDISAAALLRLRRGHQDQLK